MAESWVKGNIFQLTLEQVGKRWGKLGIQKVGFEESYLPEKGYPAEEFYSLLSRICGELADNDRDYICRMAENTIKGDQRWVVKFRRKNPGVLFNSFKYQGERYKVGDFDVVETSKNSVKLRMKLWTEDEEGGGLWAEYYKGRMQGALDLTGYSGKVELSRKKGTNEFLYDITWE